MSELIGKRTTTTKLVREDRTVVTLESLLKLAGIHINSNTTILARLPSRTTFAPKIVDLGPGYELVITTLDETPT